MEVAYQLINAGRSRGMGFSRLSRHTVKAQGRVAFTLPLRLRGCRLLSSAPYSGFVRFICWMVSGRGFYLGVKRLASWSFKLKPLFITMEFLLTLAALFIYDGINFLLRNIRDYLKK